MDLFKGSHNYLPVQRIPFSEKDEDWGKACIDYYSNYRYTNGSSLRSNRYNKLINYELYNGRVNTADIESICNPLGLQNTSWENRFQHYDVISEVLRFLEGEETKRPDDFIVVSESSEDINRKSEAIKNSTLESLNNIINATIDPSTIDPNNPPPVPEEIIKYSKYSTSDLIESKSNKLLKNLKKRLNLKQEFSRGWKDALIAAEEIYWTGIYNNEPVLRRVNPINITVILDDDTQYIDDATAVIEERYLTMPSVLDQYGDLLKGNTEALDALDKYSRGTYGTFQAPSGFQPVFEMQNNKEFYAGANITGGFNGNNFNNYSIRVCRVEWVSEKKVGIVTYTDPETNEEVKIDVDENFSLSVFKKQFPDAKVEWYWINEAWEGIRIGLDIYIGIKPKPNQRRRMDNPYHCRLGYTGFIYSATNSQSVSIVDRLKPYQYLYDIIMLRLELAFASDQGKIFLMDLAQVPESHGISLEQWMYYLKEMKIGFINSFEEGKKGTTIGQKPSFNQFQSIDLSLANTIQQYINYLEYLKNQIYFVSGVTPQRLGAINQKELVGNVEKSINQSALITEYLFEAHEEVKRRAYTALLEVAKITYRDGHTTHYVLDDMGVELLNILPLEFEDSEFNVFMSNSSKDNMIKQELKNYLQVALKQDRVELSTIIDTLFNDSTKDISNILRVAEEKFYERKQAEQDNLNKIEQAKIEQANKEHQENLDLENRKLELDQYKIDQDNATKLQVAEMATYNRQDNLDLDNNGIPDPMEIANHALKQQEINSKRVNEQLKLNNDISIKNKELAFKEKELKTKENLEKEKLANERLNMQNDKEVAKINAKNRSRNKTK